MKKKFLVSALVLASMFGFNAMAQSSSSNNEKKSCEKTECVRENRSDKSKKSDRDKRFAKGEKRQNPFEGIQLDETQKDKLKVLRHKRAGVMKERAKAMKAQMKSRMKEMVKRDSTAVAQRKVEEREYLQEVKEIIGPDNYVVFLENLVINQGARHGHDKAFNHHDGRNGKRYEKHS